MTIPSGNLLSEPNSLAVDPVNNDLYVYNGANGNIIDVPTTTGGTPKTYYTAGTTVYQQSGEFAGLAFDPAGNLYVAYYGNNTIWKFAASGSSSLYEGQNFPEQTVFHFTDSNSSDTARSIHRPDHPRRRQDLHLQQQRPHHGHRPPAGRQRADRERRQRRFRRPAFLHLRRATDWRALQRTGDRPGKWSDDHQHAWHRHRPRRAPDRQQHGHGHRRCRGHQWHRPVRRHLHRCQAGRLPKRFHGHDQLGRHPNVARHRLHPQQHQRRLHRQRVAHV